MNRFIGILGCIYFLSSIIFIDKGLVGAFSTTQIHITAVSKPPYHANRPTTHHVHRALGVNVNLLVHKNEMMKISPNLLNSSRILSLYKNLIHKYRQGFLQSSRKWVQILAASCMIYMSAGFSMNSITPRAHASSSSSSLSTLSITPKQNPIARTKDQIILDRMIDKYVKKYMFQDDVYDSFESTYRELYTDATTGKYPFALAETASTAIGRNKNVQQALKVQRFDPEKLFFDKLLEIQDLLFNRYGISKTVSRPLLFMAGIALPLFTLFFLATTFAINQKAMTERMAVKRYGESVLSADEKSEDDEGEEEEDDDEDEEDEETEKGDNKVRVFHPIRIRTL